MAAIMVYDRLIFGEPVAWLGIVKCRLLQVFMDGFAHSQHNIWATEVQGYGTIWWRHSLRCWMIPPSELLVCRNWHSSYVLGLLTSCLFSPTNRFSSMSWIPAVHRILWITVLLGSTEVHFTSRVGNTAYLSLFDYRVICSPVLLLDRVLVT